MYILSIQLYFKLKNLHSVYPLTYLKLMIFINYLYIIFHINLIYIKIISFSIDLISKIILYFINIKVHLLTLIIHYFHLLF